MFVLWGSAELGAAIQEGAGSLSVLTVERKAVPTEGGVARWLCSLLIANTLHIHCKEESQIWEKMHCFVKPIKPVLEIC